MSQSLLIVNGCCTVFISVGFIWFWICKHKEMYLIKSWLVLGVALMIGSAGVAGLTKAMDINGNMFLFVNIVWFVVSAPTTLLMLFPGTGTHPSTYRLAMDLRFHREWETMLGRLEEDNRLIQKLSKEKAESAERTFRLEQERNRHEDREAFAERVSKSMAEISGEFKKKTGGPLTSEEFDSIRTRVLKIVKNIETPLST